MQEIKREMYAMRNGIIADALRKAGSPYRFIMGVNLPQLKEIALRHGIDAGLAAELRADTACRESQLLAPMMMPSDMIDAAGAEEWIRSSTSREATDILCHSLLRDKDYALSLAARCLADDETDDEVRYAGIRLLWNLVNKAPAEVLPLADREQQRALPATLHLAASLADEARFLLEL